MLRVFLSETEVAKYYLSGCTFRCGAVDFDTADETPTGSGFDDAFTLDSDRGAQSHPISLPSIVRGHPDRGVQ